MSRTVISVEKLGKEYVIGGRENGADTFREMVVSAAAAPFRRLRRLSGKVVPEERIWALKNVGFEVKEGEIVGVIGRNGSGKSTLLKILSRITAPTEGRIQICGRVSSLLEIGTGFHPELTGRENIYLNGAILGMRRAEIDRKFDEIVDFSGVEKFLDTPVKRYSSGMSVRLAFAVAAHLEPEILLVDEVLAVGDAEFQKKCLGKMSDVASGGRTVLFVSHNMGAIRTLCGRVIVMERGRTEFDGPAERAILEYLSEDGSAATSSAEWVWAENDRPGNEDIRLRAVSLVGQVSPKPPFRPDERIMISIEYDQRSVIDGMRFVIRVLTTTGDLVFASSDLPVRKRKAANTPGRYVTECTIPAHTFNHAEYRLQVYSDFPGVRGLVPLTDMGRFRVDGAAKQDLLGVEIWPEAAVYPKLEWQVVQLDADAE